MHDWIVLSVNLDWKSARAVIKFRSDKGEESLVADGVVVLNVTQRNVWGPSVSVNGLVGPHETEDGKTKTEIEMQSGDRIVVVAETIGFEGTVLSC